MRNAIVMGLAPILLCACATRAVVHDPVTVTRYIYVSIDKGLTAPCPVAMPRGNGGDELLRVARERRRSLEGCANAKLNAISRIQGTPVPGLNPVGGNHGR